MKVAGFIANRIAFTQPAGQTGKQKSFSRFIIKLSVAATIISVAVMIITVSLANGFQQTISQKIFSFWGHIRIQEKQPDKVIISEETPIKKNDRLVAEIRKNPDVKSIHSFATKYAILKTKEDIEGVLVKGLDSSYDFNNLKQFIVAGKPLRFSDSAYSKEIMISSYTAGLMKLKVNDSLIMYFMRAGENPRPRKISIAGIYRTGIEKYDNLIALGDLKLIQRLNNWEPDQVGGYEVFLHDYKKIDSTENDLYNISEFPVTWDAISVKRVSPDIFDWLGLMDMNRNVLIVFMVVVAIINLITCLIILVLERIRMIGILKALGATDWTVQEIFLRQTLIITITGIITGTLLALVLLWLQQATGFIKLKEEAYYLSTAAVDIVWWQVLIICAGTFMISLLILMIPTLLVKRIQPVKAIQFR
ncbi:MAG: ABC transporter permease [Chitinophagaceae bacterium]|nr:ABC transporter permease [Chitinophagaceae bacterium]